MQNTAGKYMNPIELAKIPSLFQPCTKQPRVPANEIGKPIAADVPIAFLIHTFLETRYGTVNEPPPIDTKADTAPIMVDETNIPEVVKFL